MVRAAVYGALTALLSAVIGAFCLYLAIQGLTIIFLLMLPGVSLLGYIIGKIVYLGSGKKRSKGLQWLSGMITCVALCASLVFVVWHSLFPAHHAATQTQQAPSFKTFIVHVPTFAESAKAMANQTTMPTLQDMSILGVILLALAVFFACRPVAPERLLIWNQKSHRFQPFHPSETSPPDEKDDITPRQSTGFRAESIGGAIWNTIIIAFTLMVLASVLFPVFAKARPRHSNRLCNSNIRQLAQAMQMYSQDNGFQYPGIDGGSWVSKIAPYLGNSASMFMCPEDYSRESGGNSYAMSGLLIRADEKGIKEHQIMSPSEVGCVADAYPTVVYPNGRLIGGTPLGGAGINAEVVSRHSDGAIVGFCDGHSKYYQGAIDSRDLGSGVARALYQASPLGLVDNPLACTPDFSASRTAPDRVEIGGEFCTNTLLRAAAEAWEVKAKAPWHTYGFKGQYATAKRPANYLWGTGDGLKPKGDAIAIGRDAVVMIVAKGSRIAELPEMRNGTYEVGYGVLHILLTANSTRKTVHVYTFDANSGTRRFVSRMLGGRSTPLTLDKSAVTVANDLEMVEKVSNDPYGIGYCSSVFADPDRVVILALPRNRFPGESANFCYYPQSDSKHRWLVPDSPDWPWTRMLYAEYSGAAWKADGSGIANVMLAPGGAGTKALRRGPLFGTGLWGAE